MKPGRGLFSILFLLLLAVGCANTPSPLPTTSPTATPAVTPWWPCTEWPYPYPPTHPAYPRMPTQGPTRTPNAAELTATWSFLLTPSPTPLPTPIVIGYERAPLAEQEEYISATLVVAPVGAGDGELGFADYCCSGEEYARYMAVDPRGNLYILDPVNDRIVQFDADGHFVRNLAEPVASPGYGSSAFYFAVDAEGRLCYFDTQATSGVGGRCYDGTGRVVQVFPVPEWMGHIERYSMDGEGMVWVTFAEANSEGPKIDGQHYSYVTVPLGTADQLLNVRQQQERARRGALMPSGGIAIATISAHAPRDYIYDEQGVPIIKIREHESLVDVDQDGYVLTIDHRYALVHKYNPKGQLVASFQVGEGSVVSSGVFANGAIYWLHYSWAPMEYRIQYWRPK